MTDGWIKRYVKLNCIQFFTVRSSFKTFTSFIIFQYPDPVFSADGDFYIQSLPRNEGKDVGDFLHIAKVPATVSK